MVPKKELDTETLGDILEEEMTATALVSNYIVMSLVDNCVLVYRLLMRLLLGLRYML